jgi:hypothetical protein
MAVPVKILLWSWTGEDISEKYATFYIYRVEELRFRNEQGYTGTRRVLT